MILDNACPTLQGLSIKSWTSRILLHFVIIFLSLSFYITIASLSFFSSFSLSIIIFCRSGQSNHRQAVYCYILLFFLPPSSYISIASLSFVSPVPETFGDYISKFSQFGDYISRFGQIWKIAK